uniref:NDRG family member 4 n=1 Tax=Amphiprion ocellaris TaxID=80972 RepID=A0AAQ6A5A4_AMPOC
MATMKEQQFTEEKPLLPEQRGGESDLDKAEEASGGPQGPAGPAPSNHAPPPSRPAHRWHVMARHWLRQTRRRTSGVPQESCEQLMPVGDWKEHDVETPYGSLHVVIRGAPKGNKPAILTYHDVGLNHKLCFNTFFNNEDMQEITKHFVVCHVDAPGQQIGASQLPQGFQYPTMDQLAGMLPTVVQHFGSFPVISDQIQLLSDVFLCFQLIFPDLVEGLVLLNIDPNGKGWIDWAATKLSGLTSALPDTVLPHLFSQEELMNNTELVQSYRQQINNTVNQFNLQLFWNMYNSRRDLEMTRSGTAINAKTLKCPVMLVVGDNAPAEEGVPGKLTEAFKYFLQGMGYIAYVKDRRLSGGPVPSASMTRLARSRTASLTSAGSMDGQRSRACTHSDSTEGVGTISHTMEVSC